MNSPGAQEASMAVACTLLWRSQAQWHCWAALGHMGQQLSFREA